MECRQPRGRKKELKGDARRRELLEALNTLLQQGHEFADLTPQMLAKAAGISRPTFYFYFESKHQALGAALLEVQTAMQEHADILFTGPHDDPLQELQQALRGVLGTWQSEKLLMRAFVQGAASDATLWQQLEDFVGSFIAPTASSIVEIHKGQGRITDQQTATDLATALLWGNERNLYRATVADFDAKDWRNLAQTMTAIWAGAILYHPESP